MELGVLHFTKEERLTRDTTIYQAEDGTMFYNSWLRGEPERLYVKWDGTEVNATLPEGKLDSIGVFGNEMYFSTNRKIYKAVVTPSDGIIVTYLRDLQTNEEMHWPGVVSWNQEGQDYVYRLCDDPEKDAIHVNLPEDEMIGVEVAFIHRGQLFYAKRNGCLTLPSIRKLCEKAHMIELPEFERTISPYAQDSSHLIYLENGRTFFTLDTTTLEFLPSSQFDSFNCVYFIAGVQKGILTMRGITSYFDWFLMTSKLP